VITVDDRRQLDRGESIARILQGQDGQVAVFAAVAVDIDADRLVAWMRRIEDLKRSSYVLAIGRFSDPPRLEDLAGLALDDDELSAIRRCQPGDCALKLAGAEMSELRRTADEAQSAWKPTLQRAFRELILRRVTAYIARGQSALPVYQNEERPVRSAARLTALVGQLAFLNERLPDFAGYLADYPRRRPPSVESFLYWSKERLGSKASVGVTHVSILRPAAAVGAPIGPEVVVAGEQIFTTRYVNASVGMTTLIGDEHGHRHYVTYLNRSDVSVLGGPFGGIVRWIVQRRVKAEAGDVLLGLKQRLEGGESNRQATGKSP
jgi:hypothetical protein